MGTYILVNHLQSSYSQILPDEEREQLIENTNIFVEQARPHVDGVIFAFAFTENPVTHEPFDLESELPASYSEGDLMLRNDGGKGLDHEFLTNLNSVTPNPDNIILTGLFYDACISGTAITIKQNIAKTVTVPKDLVDQPDPKESIKHRALATLDMGEAGITLGKSSGDILSELKEPQFTLAENTPFT